MEFSHSEAEAWKAARRKLQAAGIDAEVEARIRSKRAGHFFAMARVAESRGLFDYAEDGQWRCLLPELWDGEIIDLVAFDLDAPHHTTTLRGLATMLGEEEADRTAYLDNEVVLYETPLQWLQSGCDGAVVLQFSPPPWCLADCLLSVSSLALRDRLQAAYAVPRPPMPRFRVFHEQETGA